MINRVFGNMEVFVIPRYLECGNTDVWKYRCMEIYVLKYWLRVKCHN